MKKRLIPVLAFAALLTLAGCGATISVYPTISSSTPSSETPSSSSVADKVFTVELSKTEAKIDDTVTVIGKLDDSIVTSITVTATAGADLVTITGSSVKCNANGSVTLHVVCTDSGKTYSKDATLTIAGTVYTSIATIQATEGTFAADAKSSAKYASEVTIKGKVMQISKYNLLTYDGTGYMLVDTGSYAKFKIGDYITAVDTPERYKASADDIRWWTMPSATVTKITDATPIADPTATDLSLTDLEAYTTPSAGQAKFIKTSMYGTVKTSGTYVNIYFDGCTDKDLSYSYYGTDLTYTEGVKYKFTGFMAEMKLGTGSDQYDHINFYPTALEAAPFDPITSITITGDTATVEVGAIVRLDATIAPETANPGMTWSVETGKESILSVDEDGVVTGLAAGTAKVIVTSAGKNASEAVVTDSIDVTVSASTLASEKETYTYVKETGTTVADPAGITYSSTNFDIAQQKGTSSTDVKNSYAEMRIYNGHKVVFTPKATSTYITRIVLNYAFTDNSDEATNKYTAVNTAGTAYEGIDYYVNGKVGTVYCPNGAKSVTLTHSSSTLKINSIDIYYQAA